MRTYLNIIILMAILVLIAFIGSYDFKAALFMLGGITVGMCGLITLMKLDIIDGGKFKE